MIGSRRGNKKKVRLTPLLEMKGLKWFEVSGFPILYYADQDREVEYTKFKYELASHEKMYIYATFMLDKIELDKELGEVLPIQTARFFIGVPRNDRLQVFRGTEVKFPVNIYKVAEERIDYVKLEDGRYARALVPDIRDPPGSEIEEACLARLYPINVMPERLDLLMKIEHVPESKVDYYIGSFKRESAARSLAVTTTWRQKHLEHLKILEEDRMNNATTHKFTYMFVLSDKDLGRLRSATDSVVSNAKNLCTTRLDVPKYVQRDLVGQWRIDYVRLTMITTDTRLMYLYPFVNSSVIESGGVFFAVTDRGSPVIFNPWDRRLKENGHIIFTGFSGSGKTTSAAALLHRLLKRLKEREERFTVFVIDPIGNFNRFFTEFIGPELGLDVEVRFLDEKSQMGLDPLLLHSLSPEAMPIDMALNYIYQAFEVPPDLRGVIDIAAVTGLLRDGDGERRISSLRDLYEYLSSSGNPKDKEASYYIARAVEGAYRNVFMGEPPKFTKDIVVIGFNINDLSTLQTAMGLLLNSILVKFYSLPRGIKKVVVVDEAHRILAKQALAYIMSRFFRETRNLNASAIAMSQLITDFTNSDEAKAVYENAATRIILKQKQDKLVARELSEFAGLSDIEIDFVQHASPGMGILNLGNVKTPIYIRLTSKELNAFQTEEAKRREAEATL